MAKTLTLDVTSFKFADNETDLSFRAIQNGVIISDSTLSATIKIKQVDGGYLKSVSAKWVNNHIVISSGDLSDLPVDSYLLELWLSSSSGYEIYPDSGFVRLYINQNATGISGNLISSITLGEFQQQFSDLSKEVNNKIDDLHVQTDSNTSNIELKANQTDLESLQSVVNNQSSTISTKANQTDLENLQTTVTSQSVAISTVETDLSQTKILLANGLNSKVDKGGGGQITLPMLSTDVKTAMTGGSVPVVGKNAVLAENIVKDTISPDEVGFVSRKILSNTLVDDTKIKRGGYYDYTTGMWKVRADYNSTGLIPCVLGQSYTRSLLHGQISYYDKNGLFVIGDSPYNTMNFKVPDNSNISYMRLSFSNSAYPGFTVNRGTQLLGKDSYTEEYSIDLNLDTDNKINTLEIDVSEIKTKLSPGITLQSFNSIGDISTTQYRIENYKTTFWLTKINRDTFNGGKIKPKVRLTSSSIDSGDPKSVLDYITNHDTMCCINAGVFDVTSGIVDGRLIIDGVVQKDSAPVIHKNQWTLGIKSDGSLSAYDSTISASEILKDNCESAVTGFVPIIMNGSMVDKSLFLTFDHLTQPNPRQVICQNASGDYFVFSCDGRKDSEEGLTLEQIGNILLSFGITFAYNLDGGGSTQTFVKKKRVNRLIENRPIPSIIVFE